MANARMNVLTGNDVTTALCSLLNALLASGSGLDSENKGLYSNFAEFASISRIFCIIIYFDLIFYSDYFFIF